MRKLLLEWTQSFEILISYQNWILLQGKVILDNTEITFQGKMKILSLLSYLVTALMSALKDSLCVYAWGEHGTSVSFLA